MLSKITYFFLFFSTIVGTFFISTSCQPKISIQAGNQKIPVSSETVADMKIAQIIQPYKDSLDKSMNEIIGKADTNFLVQRPSSNMMNWMADAVFTNQTRTVRLAQPAICLLNTGGIRSGFFKGNITIGDVFKVMPFDNTIVWVELPIEVKPEIEAFLQKTGGEPLANAQFLNGKLSLNGENENTKSFLIITSDYLANGGDKMDFFKKGKIINNSGKLLREALLEEVKFQGTLLNRN